MLPFMCTLLLTYFKSTVPAYTHYPEYPSDYYNVDPSSIVFPASIISPFSTPNRLQNSGDLQTQYLYAVEALFAVTARLKALLSLDTSKNLLVSPISTTTALAELLLGARGSSRRHLLNILTTVNRSTRTAEATVAEFHQHLGGLIKLLQISPDYDESYRLHLASALFLQPGLSLLSDFHRALTDLYGVDVVPADFSGDPSGSLNMINQWAATHTMGVINKVFNHPLPPTTAAVFTNAIYFKGDWETPFNSRFTIEGTFRSNDTHTVDVQFMRGQFDLMYVDSERLGCRMIAIPYRHAKAAMYVILPERGDLYKIRRFAAGLSVDDIRELISSTRLSSVTLLMPKMKLSHTLSFRNVLSQFQEQNEPEFQKLHAPGPHYKKTQESEIGAQPLGCHGWNCSQYGQAPCNLSAQFAKPTMAPEKEDRFYFDMSGASPDQRFRVDDVVENIFLEVSEVGTIGAAVGTTTVDYIGEFRNFKLDRPFLFFIRHEITGTLFFWGAIVDPTNDEGT